MLEKTLKDAGMSDTLAHEVSRAGCERLIRPAGRKVRSRASKLVDKVKSKTKRKASAYSKRVGANLRSLKKKHPRTPVTKLMKKAHRMAKRK